MLTSWGDSTIPRGGRQRSTTYRGALATPRGGPTIAQMRSDSPQRVVVRPPHGWPLATSRGVPTTPVGCPITPNGGPTTPMCDPTVPAVARSPVGIVRTPSIPSAGPPTPWGGPTTPRGCRCSPRAVRRPLGAVRPPEARSDHPKWWSDHPLGAPTTTRGGPHSGNYTAAGPAQFLVFVRYSYDPGSMRERYP